jgi:hypothetical protein
MTEMTQSTGKHPLGALVKDYRPLRRRDLALQVLGSATLAAAAWWGVEYFDGRIWILIPFLVALPANLYCLAAVFRWLSPGDRVAVHVHGVRIGAKALPWDSIAGVSYQLDLGSDNDPTESRTHKFQFHLRDGSVTPLNLDDCEIPTHVDIDEFIQHLRDVPLDVEVAHEPKLRSEPAGESVVQRDALLAARLKAALARLLAKAGHEAAPQFTAALRDGDRVRGRIARRARWMSLGYGFLVLPGTLLLVLAVIAGLLGLLTIVLCGVQGLGALVGITLDLVDTRDFPIELSTFAIAGGFMVGATAVASWLGPAVETWYGMAQRSDALASGLRQRGVRQSASTHAAGRSRCSVG